MENKASQLVSSLIAGKRFKTFVIGGRGFTLKSPTIKTMCLSINEFAQADIDFNDFNLAVFTIPQKMSHLLRGIAYLLVGMTDDFETKVDEVSMYLECGTPKEILSVLQEFIDMTSLKEVFQIAASAMKYAEAAAKQK